MTEIWEHGRMEMSEPPGWTWHLYTTFEDTRQWAKDHDNAGGTFAEAVDRLGREGWQLVAVDIQDIAWNYWFKRRRAD